MLINKSWEFSSAYDTNYTTLYSALAFKSSCKHYHFHHTSEYSIPRPSNINTNNWLINYWTSLKSTTIFLFLLAFVARRKLCGIFHSNLAFLLCPLRKLPREFIRHVWIVWLIHRKASVWNSPKAFWFFSIHRTSRRQIYIFCVGDSLLCLWLVLFIGLFMNYTSITTSVVLLHNRIIKYIRLRKLSIFHATSWVGSPFFTTPTWGQWSAPKLYPQTNPFELTI